MQTEITTIGVNLRFPILSTDRYLSAQQTAKDAVIKRIEEPKLDKEPKLDDFKTSTGSQYPSWFIGGVIAALLVVMIASFIISAGKQVAASGLMFDHLPGKFSRLTSTWADASVIAMLILSEVGAVLFLVSSGTIAHSAPKFIYHWTDKAKQPRETAINVTQWVLRTFAFVCAGYAILSNITITVLDPLDNVAAWLQWAISIFMPITVLGLGVLLERIIIDALRTSAERQRRYAQAMQEYRANVAQAMQDYRAVIAAPEKHDYFPAVLLDAIYDEIMRLKANRDRLGELLALIQTDQQYKVWLVQAEYAAHQQSNTLLPDGANPFLLPVTARS